VLELDAGLEFNPENDEEFFSLLPERPAVCLIEAREAAAEPHVIRTANLRRRLQRLLGPADPSSKRLNLRHFARQVRYRVTNAAFEQALTYYRIAKQLFPKRYRDLMRLRPSPVLKINLKNAYPRCYVTRHISVNERGEALGGIYFGPFPSRKVAQAYADSVLDFFKVRRCQIKIRRDPSFPGCIYSEMKMCLAPCFAGCTKEEYDVEVNRLVEFLQTSGGSLRATYEREREQASEELDFERAAACRPGDCAPRAGPECGDLAAHSRRTDNRPVWGTRRPAGGAVRAAIWRYQPAAFGRGNDSRLSGSDDERAACCGKSAAIRNGTGRAPAPGGAVVLQQPARGGDFLSRKGLALPADLAGVCALAGPAERRNQRTEQVSDNRRARTV